MKPTSKIASFFLAATMLAATAGWASAPAGDKVVDKARATVENAAPDDWEALARAAEMCLRKKQNIKQANEWLDKSLAIKRTVYNTELKGDYYLQAKLPRQAIIFYVESMKKAKELDFNVDTSVQMEKIAKANALYAKIG